MVERKHTLFIVARNEMLKIDLHERFFKGERFLQQKPVLSIGEDAPGHTRCFGQIHGLIQRDAVLEIEVKTADTFFEVSSVPLYQKQTKQILVIGSRAPLRGAGDALLFRPEKGEIGSFYLFFEIHRLRFEGETEELEDGLHKVQFRVNLTRKSLHLLKARDDIHKGRADLLRRREGGNTLETGRGKERISHEGMLHLKPNDSRLALLSQAVPARNLHS